MIELTYEQICFGCASGEYLSEQVDETFGNYHKRISTSIQKIMLGNLLKIMKAKTFLNGFGYRLMHL